MTLELCAETRNDFRCKKIIASKIVYIAQSFFNFLRHFACFAFSGPYLSGIFWEHKIKALYMPYLNVMSKNLTESTSFH